LDTSLNTLQPKRLDEFSEAFRLLRPSDLAAVPRVHVESSMWYTEQQYQASKFDYYSSQVQTNPLGATAALAKDNEG
jgi:hypothetical protein